jgi:hypothetical protein
MAHQEISDQIKDRLLYRFNKYRVGENKSYHDKIDNFIYLCVIEYIVLFK